MGELSLFRKGLFVALVVVGGGLFVSSCNKEELISDRTDQNETLETRSSSEYHWRCSNPTCGMLNSSWQTKCISCNHDYSETHGILISDFIKVAKSYIKIGSYGGGTLPKKKIELPDGSFLLSEPEKWYETSCALKYYNSLKNSSTYRLTPGYAEGVDFAWFRTTHVLFPKYHDKNKVEQLHDRFILSEGRNLTGFKGQGIKDGSKAAVEAFVTCR